MFLRGRYATLVLNSIFLRTGCSFIQSFNIYSLSVYIARGIIMSYLRKWALELDLVPILALLLCSCVTLGKLL